MVEQKQLGPVTETDIAVIGDDREGVEASPFQLGYPGPRDRDGEQGLADLQVGQDAEMIGRLDTVGFAIQDDARLAHGGGGKVAAVKKIIDAPRGGII